MIPEQPAPNYPGIRQIFRHNFSASKADPEPLRIANDPPPWRSFQQKTTVDGPFRGRPMLEDQARRGRLYQADEIEAQMINAALVLRRPLLVAGHAGVGKTSLAYAVAWQLGLGNVLRWSITSRSTLKDALYEYDAVARLQDASLKQSGMDQVNPQNIGQYITLGPLGTALLPNISGPYQPRVLLIDEIDKSDIDLPNDLLHVLEEGAYDIPEIARFNNSRVGNAVTVRTWRGMGTAEIPPNGVVTCDDFPLVILTTNGEREFSPAFRRRCLEITIPRPDHEKLERILRSQLNLQGKLDTKVQNLLEVFDKRMRDERFGIAVDQLLNAIYLSQSKTNVDLTEHTLLLEALFHSLTE
jgi:MoxR-like ATPase